MTTATNDIYEAIKWAKFAIQDSIETDDYAEVGQYIEILIQEIDRLNKHLDGYTDSLLKERKCTEEYIKEFKAAQKASKVEEITVEEFNNMIDPQMPSFRNIGNMFLEKYANKYIRIVKERK